MDAAVWQRYRCLLFRVPYSTVTHILLCLGCPLLFNTKCLSFIVYGSFKKKCTFTKEILGFSFLCCEVKIHFLEKNVCCKRN